MTHSNIHVLLWEHAGTGLIVPRRTGVVYANQVAGHSCFEMRCEGFFVPIANDVGLEPDHQLRSPENELFHYFQRHPSWDNFTSKHADAVEHAFKGFSLWQGLTVDRLRLNECYEAWVHVNVTFETDVYEKSVNRPCLMVTGLGASFSAILTWTNTD